MDILHLWKTFLNQPSLIKVIPPTLLHERSENSLRVTMNARTRMTSHTTLFVLHDMYSIMLQR